MYSQDVGRLYFSHNFWQMQNEKQIVSNKYVCVLLLMQSLQAVYIFILKFENIVMEEFDWK